MGDDSRRFLIAGGGIGGLAAALALHRAGLEVTVLEKAPRIQELGTGVQIWLNGSAALERLGVGPEAQACGAPMEVEELRSLRGSRLMRVPVGELASQAGCPPAFFIGRPQLVGVLHAALPDGAVQTGSEVAGYEQDDEGVSVRLTDGRVERGIALIGAEGLVSPTRDQLMPGVRPQYAGYQYLRATTEHKSAPADGSMTMTFGRGDRFGIHDMHAGQVYWFGVIVVPEGQQDSQGGRQRDLLDRFGHFPEPIPALIKDTPEEHIFRTDIFDIDPMKKWGEDRVTLLGDSAHATTPNLGRGASEALEDAAVLGECVSEAELFADGDALCRVLREYERRRIGPTAKIQSDARRIGRVSSWRDPVRCRIRDMVFTHIAGRSTRKDIEMELAKAAAGRPVADRRPPSRRLP